MHSTAGCTTHVLTCAGRTIPKAGRRTSHRWSDCDVGDADERPARSAGWFPRHWRMRLMGDGGIQECGYAQNCVEICPKSIPLTTSIAEVGGQVMIQALTDLLRK